MGIDVARSISSHVYPYFKLKVIFLTGTLDGNISLRVPLGIFVLNFKKWKHVPLFCTVLFNLHILCSRVRTTPRL